MNVAKNPIAAIVYGWHRLSATCALPLVHVHHGRLSVRLRTRLTGVASHGWAAPTFGRLDSTRRHRTTGRKSVPPISFGARRLHDCIHMDESPCLHVK